jgi:hypothetical protein
LRAFLRDAENGRVAEERGFDRLRINSASVSKRAAIRALLK